MCIYIYIYTHVQYIIHIHVLLFSMILCLHKMMIACARLASLWSAVTQFTRFRPVPAEARSACSS